MKRKAIGFVVSLAVLLFVCSSAKGGEKSITRPGKPGTSLVLMIWADPAEKTAIMQVLQKFQKENPVDIKVIHADSLSYSDKLAAMFAGETPPDVFSLHIQNFSQYASKGLLCDLDSFAQDPDFNISDFYPELIRAFSYDGKLYAVPKDWTSFVLYYNMDLFDKAGIPYPNDDWTWDDFLQAAKRLTHDNDGDGIPEQYGAKVETRADWYYSWIRQNGGEIFDKDGKWVFTKKPYADANTEAIQFIADLMNKYKVAPNVLTSSQFNPYELFLTGRVGMCIYGRWAMVRFKEMKDYKWNYTTLPKRVTKASMVVGTSYAMSSEAGRDKNKAEAAWKLIKFLTGKSGQLYAAKSGLAVPSRKSVVNSPGYLEAPDVVKNQPHLKKTKPEDDPFIRSLEYAVFTPTSLYWIEIRAILDEALDDVFLGNKNDMKKAMRLIDIKSDMLFQQDAPKGMYGSGE